MGKIVFHKFQPTGREYSLTVKSEGVRLKEKVKKSSIDLSYETWAVFLTRLAMFVRFLRGETAGPGSTYTTADVGLKYDAHCSVKVALQTYTDSNNTPRHALDVRVYDTKETTNGSSVPNEYPTKKGMYLTAGAALGLHAKLREIHIAIFGQTKLDKLLPALELSKVVDTAVQTVMCKWLALPQFERISQFCDGCKHQLGNQEAHVCVMMPEVCRISAFDRYYDPEVYRDAAEKSFFIQPDAYLPFDFNPLEPLMKILIKRAYDNLKHFEDSNDVLSEICSNAGIKKTNMSK